MRTMIAAAALFTVLGSPFASQAQVGQFATVRNGRDLLVRLNKSITEITIHLLKNRDFNTDVWEKTRRLYDYALESSLIYEGAGDFAQRIRSRIARFSIDTGNMAVERRCFITGRRLLIQMIEDNPEPLFTSLRELARIGLDDLRHRLLLDALEGRR